MIKKKPKINVLVDTNILLRASIQEQERNELEQLIDYSKQGHIRLFISEIVIDEIEKSQKDFDNKLNQEISKVSQGIREIFKPGKIWNDLNDCENYLVDALYEYKGNKYNLYTEFIEEFNKLTNSNNITLLKPDLEKFYSIQREITKGNIPRINSNDIQILGCIEDLCSKMKNEKLYYITENKKDFFETDINGNYIKNPDGSYIIKGLEFDFVSGFVSIRQVLVHIKKELGETNE